MFVSPNNANPVFCNSLSMRSNHTKPLVRFSCRATCKNMATEADATTDYYKLLSLSRRSNASRDEIKRAYRELALQYHPDVCDPSLKDQSTRMFVQLNAAYKTLSDPVLRREYDDCMLGLRNHHGRSFEMDVGCSGKTVWQQQILELKRRSTLRRDGSSWGSRMRARNHWSWQQK